jgi:hypothetical protein
MPRLRDRPTPDLIVIIFTMVIAVEVVVVTMFAVVGILYGNAEAVKELLKTISELTNGLIALVVGYMAGRGVNSSTDISSKGGTNGSDDARHKQPGGEAD